MTIETGKTPERDSMERLEEGVGEIIKIAEDWGLSLYPIDFEVVPPRMMHEFGAYGIPGHFSHWSFGRAYRQLKTHYDYGLSRIYEMVVNSDPSRAFLLENNGVVTNLMVAAHVCGHVDFFKENYLFKPTIKDMPIRSEVRGDRIREYEKQYGRREIEEFLDSVLVLSGHIEPSDKERLSKQELLLKWKKEYEAVPKRKATEFDEYWRLVGDDEEVNVVKDRMRVPLHPDKDLLGFIRDFAPDLVDWQRDILDIVREESYYFYPQMRTKTMNEGWASFWHKRIMHEMVRRGHLSTEEASLWWELHAGVASPREAGFNPYWFGMMMWEYLVDYYNGNVSNLEKKWLLENNLPVYPEYSGDLIGSPGLAKIREIMMTNDDISFVRNYFNYIPANRMNTYLFDSFESDGEEFFFISNTNWVEVRDYLVAAFSKGAGPVVEVIDSDYRLRHELLLYHNFEGDELDSEYLHKTMLHCFRIWKRPVHILARIKGKVLIVTADDKGVKSTVWAEADSYSDIFKQK